MITQKKRVLANIFEICGLSRTILKNNCTSRFVLIRAEFDALKKIEEIYPKKMFIWMKIENTTTREIVYSIFSEILGSVKNPRKQYGTNLSAISESMRKNFQESICVLTDNVNPKAIERFLCLDIPICVIAQPKYFIKKLRDLAGQDTAKATEIKIRADAGALEHYARVILPNITNRNLFNPWHPFTPHAMVDLLNLTKGNVILFSYMLGNLGQADLVKDLKSDGILEATYKEYIRRELSPQEREVLRRILQGGVLKTNLKQEFPSISNTRLMHLLRKLSKMNFVKRSRYYTDYESVFWELNPEVAEIIGKG